LSISGLHNRYRLKQRQLGQAALAAAVAAAGIVTIIFGSWANHLADPFPYQKTEALLSRFRGRNTHRD
jgi:hypothetical protein